MPKPKRCRFCKKKVLARGLCSAHYWRAKRGSSAASDPEPVNAGDRTETISVAMRPKVYAQVKKMAERAGVSLSKSAETLIEAALVH